VTVTLEDRIRDVLARLSVLSEVSASSLEPRMSGNSESPSKPPPGVSRGLYDYWSERFARLYAEGKSEFEIHRDYLLAERDWAACTMHSPDRMALRSGEATDNDAVNGGAAEAAAADRVIELYEGVPAVEVAVHEYTTEAWVRKARAQRGRNPTDGRPRPEFLDWDEDRRTREVASLASRMGQKKAADRLGVAKSTLQRYWPELVAA
jgi:hypothetical protein